MNILLTGGTGFIGRHLIQASPNDTFTVLSRNAGPAQHRLGAQATVIDTLPDALDAFDAVINLAGEPIADKRWSQAQKQRIEQSRWLLTEQLAQRCLDSSDPPAVLISGSAVGFYGRQGEKTVDEHAAPHPEFTHEVCREWEERANHAASAQTRVCLLRTGIVLGSDGGALKKMLLPFRLGLGGPLGEGKQYMPWIHIRDEVRAIRFLLETAEASGPFNLTAPFPVTNNTFTQVLANTLKRPALFRVPGFGLRLMLGEMADLVLTGQRAEPHALLRLGFTFEFPELRPALEDLLG